MVSVLGCQASDLGFKSRPGKKIGFEISAPLRFLVNSTMMSTLIVHYQWEDEVVRERTGHPSLYAEVKKMKLLTLYAHG